MDTHEVRLLIDTRETRLLGIMRAPHTAQTLPIGDILLESDGLRLLIERKTCEDLTASMKDGRYREQRSRLLSWRNEHQKVMYLIEGCGDVDCRALQRLMIAYDVPVWRTSSIEETRDYIEWICAQGLVTFFRRRDPVQDRVEAMRFGIAMTKSKILCAETLLVSALTLIHGVSYEMAQGLARGAASLDAFIRGFDPTAPCEYRTSSGTVKSAGKAVRLRIRDLMGISTPTPTPTPTLHTPSKT